MFRTTGYRSGALIAALSLAACSSGGSDPVPPAFDATSHWMLWLEDPGSMDESGPYGSYVMANAAGNLDGVALTGQVSGNNVNISVDVSSGTLTLSGVMAGSEVAGTAMLSGVPVTGNFRMQMFSPAGTLSGNGTVGGTPVAANSSTAFCERYYSDVSLTTLVSVNVSDDDGAMRYEIDFLDPSILGIGTINVSAADQINVIAGTDSARNEAIATSGTVTVTQYDAGGLAATYNLDLPGAENVTGSFSVVFDLDVYDP